MVTYLERYKPALPALLVAGLSACGGSDDGLDKLGISTQTPLVCQSPQVINAAGTACETPVSNCPLPLEDGPLAGTCVESLIPWPDGTNGITMPEPVYTAAQRDDGSFSEIVYYFNRESGDFDGFGLHAWNGSGTLCQAYAQFDVPDGGTDWGVPIEPTGEDPNFGIYFVLELRENPVCGNFIPYNFNAGIQSDADLQVDLSSAEVNPSGNFFVLARNEADRYNAGTIFPYPRTYESLIVPGGAPPQTVECEFPEAPNEDSTECFPPVIGEFTPGEVPLYLRGGFNDWGNEENLNDTTAFHYADGLYTVTQSIVAPAEGTGYDFKVADFDWVDATTFGVIERPLEERTIALDEPRALVTGKLGNGTEEGSGDDVESNIHLAVAEDMNYQFTINAQDPTAPTLTVTQVPLPYTLFIRGSMNSFGNDEEGNFSLASGVAVMRYEGESVYAGRLTLEASDTPYEFKVADAGMNAVTNFGASAGNEVLALNEAKILEAGEGSQNMQFTVTEPGTFLLTMDVTDPAAPSLTIRNAIPYDAPIFVRGGMNGWGLDDPMEYEGEGIYTRVMPLAASDAITEFKVASEDWATADFGTDPDDADGQVVTLGTPKTMGFGGENLRITTPEGGDFMFHVDANERLSPVLTVRNLDAFAETPIFVRGSLNDWGSSDQMTYIGSGVYQAAIALTAGDYAFKVASEDWAAANYGAAEGGETIAVDETFTATPGETSGNISITIDADGTYLFHANVTDLDSPSIVVQPIAPYGDTPVFVRGSMNDWGTANEMTFDGTATYTLDLELAAQEDPYQFKVASEDWATVNFGNPEPDTNMTFNRDATLIGGEPSQNIGLVVAEDGTFRFVFTVTDPTTPILRVIPMTE